MAYWAELPGSARTPVLFSSSVVTVASSEFLILHKYLLCLDVVVPSMFKSYERIVPSSAVLTLMISAVVSHFLPFIYCTRTVSPALRYAPCASLSFL